MQIGETQKLLAYVGGANPAIDSSKVDLYRLANRLNAAFRERFKAELASSIQCVFFR